MKCRLCRVSLRESSALKLNVPAGTQLFSYDLDTSLSLVYGIEIIQCHKCSLIQLTGKPVIYEHVSSSSSHVSANLTQHRLDQINRLVAFRPELQKTGSLLEIGCGDGHLLHKLKDMFPTAVGIEPAGCNANVAVNRGLKVFQLMVDESTQVEHSPFDYFCSFHVLEHVTDIGSFLKGVHNNLAHDAVGVFEVPATEAAFEHKRYGDFMPDHLNYFTEKTLNMALEWNGFRVLSLYRDWNNEHLVAYVKRSTHINLVNELVFDRQQKLSTFVAAIEQTSLPFVLYGISHHLMPYMPILSNLKTILAVDDSESKISRYVPSTSIKVQSSRTIRSMTTCILAITSPRFENEILSSVQKMFNRVHQNDMLSNLLGFPVFYCHIN